jgi:anti-sigma factor RsiW
MAECHEQKVQELLPWYVNETLNEEEFTLVENHLKTCVDCQRAVEELKIIQANLILFEDEGLLDNSAQ